MFTIQTKTLLVITTITLLMLCTYSTFATINILFDKERGFYDAPFELNIAVEGEAVNTIKYTIDGSDPETSYSGVFLRDAKSRIAINTTTVFRIYAANDMESVKKSHTYIFLEDVIKQGNYSTITELDYPPLWGTGPINLANDTTITQTGDYEMDDNVTKNPAYSGDLIDGLLQIPTLSIATDKKNLFDKETGIYTNPLEKGAAWEIPVSIELINTGKAAELCMEAGLSISGDISRKLDYFKHSFRLNFDEKYGIPELEYPLFKDGATNVYKALELGMIESVSPHDFYYSHRTQTQFHRDEWARNLYREMGNLSSNSKFVHLYLNGLYWGMYNLAEIPNADFLTSYLGGNKSDYDVLEALNITQGDSVDYYKMFEIANSAKYDTIYGDSITLYLKVNEEDANRVYDSLNNHLDIKSYIDYFLLNTFLVNTDWPSNNWWAAKKKAHGAKWQFFMWDAEYILHNSPIYTAKVFNADEDFKPFQLDKKLRPVKRYKSAFADRVQCNCLEKDGPLHIDNLIKSYNKLEATINKASILELARWGDIKGFINADGTGLIDYNDHVLVEKLRYENEIFPNLLTNIMQFYQYKNVQYFPKGIDAVEFGQLGGAITNGFKLKLTNPNNDGEIYYTLDGSDPKTPNNPETKKYTEPINIVDYTKVSARVLIDTFTYGLLQRDTIFNHWSAMCPREFFGQNFISVERLAANLADLDIELKSFQSANQDNFMVKLIDRNSNLIDDNLKLNVYNNAGNLLLREAITVSEFEYNTLDLNSGEYPYEITSDNNFIMGGKIIKH